MKRFASFLSTGLVVFGALLLVGLAIGPRTGRYETLTVLTGSMAPEIPQGSVIVAVPIPASSVKVGDVIAFRAPTPQRQVVTHRVNEIVKPGAHPVIRTKGDHNEAIDQWTATIDSNKAWKVVWAVPGLGSAIIALRSTVAHVALTWLVPSLLAVIWLKGIWRKPANTAHA